MGQDRAPVRAGSLKCQARSQSQGVAASPGELPVVLSRDRDVSAITGNSSRPHEFVGRVAVWPFGRIVWTATMSWEVALALELRET